MIRLKVRSAAPRFLLVDKKNCSSDSKYSKVFLGGFFYFHFLFTEEVILRASYSVWYHTVGYVIPVLYLPSSCFGPEDFETRVFSVGDFRGVRARRTPRSV
jgi:hypothetical protein